MVSIEGTVILKYRTATRATVLPPDWERTQHSPKAGRPITHQAHPWQGLLLTGTLPMIFSFSYHDWFSQWLLLCVMIITLHNKISSTGICPAHTCSCYELLTTADGGEFYIN